MEIYYCRIFTRYTHMYVYTCIQTHTCQPSSEKAFYFSRCWLTQKPTIDTDIETKKLQNAHLYVTAIHVSPPMAWNHGERGVRKNVLAIVGDDCKEIVLWTQLGNCTVCSQSLWQDAQDQLEFQKGCEHEVHPWLRSRGLLLEKTRSSF